MQQNSEVYKKMKNRYSKTLPMLILLAGLTGCTAANETVIDDVTGKAGAAQETKAAEVSSSTASAVSADGQPIQEVIIPQESAINTEKTDASAQKTADENNSSVNAQTKAVEQEQKSTAQALYTVHFDFNQYTVNDTEKELLAKNAAWLESSPKTRIIIEGHADERGETEYNLALGDRRARSIKKFLQDLGIAQERLSTISYGEEKPAAQGHDEAAWTQNRRVEFKVTD